MANNGISQAHGINAGFCLCGCGQETSVKANYRPGHDAAHVSNLLATIVRLGDFSQAVVSEYMRALPSMPLRQKLERAVDNFVARKSAKTRTPKTEWVACDTDEYKIGRWAYPVQVEMSTNQDDTEYYGFRRNTKRDGSGEWVALEGGELVSL